MEACPDKVFERAEIKRKNLGEADLLSDSRRVGQFVERTGVDLVVPNLGTEHRTASDVRGRVTEVSGKCLTNGISDMAECHAHDLKFAGSNPAPATIYLPTS